MQGLLTLLLAVVLATTTLGCGIFGGGVSADDELLILEFDDAEPTPEPAFTQENFNLQLELSRDTGVLVAIRYLYGHQIHLESLRQANRDLQALVDYSSPSDVDLEWVIEVHEVTAEVDALFERLTERGVPLSQRKRYGDLFVKMLDAAQVIGYGSDRVLAGALKVGPGGRTLLTMPEAEVEEFKTLMREAEFYLSDSERLLDAQLKEMETVISLLSLR